MTVPESKRILGMALKILLFAMPLLAGFEYSGKAQGSAQAPGPPATGPGTAGKYAVRQSTYGAGGKQYWIFQPDSNETVPVVVFLHGFSNMDPHFYSAWIDHIVSRGNIVIYPRYQATLNDPLSDMTPNAIEAIKDALSKLGGRADTSKFAVVGHSLGGMISFNVAADASSVGLPAVRALMSVNPGDADSVAAIAQRYAARRGMKPLREADRYGQIPRNTLTLVVAAEEDRLAGQQAAKIEFSAIPQIPCENKNYVVVRSDDHGDPALAAIHSAPTASSENIGRGQTPNAAPAQRGRGLRAVIAQRRGPIAEQLENPKGEVDALDYYAYWKLFDGLTDAAFFGRNRDYALGGGPRMTFMGNWSDGKPVNPLQVSNDQNCGRSTTNR